jgi:hypothetical protein
MYVHPEPMSETYMSAACTETAEIIIHVASYHSSTCTSGIGKGSRSQPCPSVKDTEAVVDLETVESTFLRRSRD